jgi:excinuclease ABC subunit A
MGQVRVEMQFLSDVFVTCPTCNGKRFTDEVLAVEVQKKSVLDVMDLTVNEAVLFFKKSPKITKKLSVIQSVGLGYLKMGQTLSTLSGGEAQRLKLVRYLEGGGKLGGSEHRILLLDEPTTGLHREDVSVLLKVFHQLVEQGNSLIVIEHQLDVIKAADWVIEMGPGSGSSGGKFIAEGTPEHVAALDVPSSDFLSASLRSQSRKKESAGGGDLLLKEVAEKYRKGDARESRNIEVIDASEHNLKNISVSILPNTMTIITGVSGSGKSTLAFDIIFSEGQRRFLESLSSYTRQFVDQLAKPAVRAIYGLSPSVAIEQRETVGHRKSTVATVTEVAHYLRLLFARAGVIVNPKTGNRVENLSLPEVVKLVEKALLKNKTKKHLYLLAPRIRNRKGHHEPVAKWAEKLGYSFLRCDGVMVPVPEFKGLDRYKEHSLEVAVCDLGKDSSEGKRVKASRVDVLDSFVSEALQLGNDACLLCDEKGGLISWFSTKSTDPLSGEAFQLLDPKDFSWNSPRGWCVSCQGHGRIWKEGKGGRDWIDMGVCPDCSGDRLNPVSRAVVLDLEGDESVTLPHLLHLSVDELVVVLRKLVRKDAVAPILDSIMPEIEERLNFMTEVGLSYLSLDRSAVTLSGGEAQRIRLASQLGSYLSGVLYVLDEPSIGLHARDNEKLIEALEELRDRGNTVLVVEHDEAIMRRADQIIDMGPAAGKNGGEIVAQGTPAELLKSKKSLTGMMLKEGISHPLRGKYRCLPKKNTKAGSDWISVKGAALRNLKGIDVQIPLNRLIGVCGVSGAGKSTLVKDLLIPALSVAVDKKISKLTGKAFLEHWDHGVGSQYFKEVVNGHSFARVLEVDQSPIGKTPRSVPATYVGLYDWIRKIFAALPDSKIRGFDIGRFSFNVQGGRCEACGGLGKIGIEMNFLPKAYVDCEECRGNRYSSETCEIHYRGKSIADVMAMSFEEAREFFAAHKKPRQICEWMVETGLGYIQLGQASPTLSGGEAQRMKIVSELAKGGGFGQLDSIKGRETLFVLEEPSIGLHLSDCKRLIEVLHHLVDQGHTVIVIEHNTDLLAEMDWLIELGPEGGDAGGELIFQGTVPQMKKDKKSVTGVYL